MSPEAVDHDRMQMDHDPELDRYLEVNRERRMASYLEFLRIPGISSLPAHASDCRLTADWVAGQLAAMGVEHVEVAETGGHPIVYGDWLHAEGAPTVLVYGHYDVQPVDPLGEWETAPFDPIVRGDRVIARGAADDKGQVHMHLRAVEALLETRGRLPVNMRFLIEGEEEIGSVHLDRWLEANRERLHADLAVISDTRFFHGNLPALTISLRGMMYAQIDVSGPVQDLHSGGYGGAVRNPANALCLIVGSLTSPDGRVLVPGFYDAVEPLSNAERAALAGLPFDEEAYRAAIGVPVLEGEPGYTTAERLATRPSLDVNGLWSGFSGEGTKTIIPAHAHAKVSCRLVADQDPHRIFELLRAHVEAVAPAGVRVDVRLIGSARPFQVSRDHPAIRAAGRAIEATFGVPPVHAREGVSIPVCASLESALGLPILLLGFGPPDDQSHAPNEWMSLANHETGIRTIARLFDELAPMSPASWLPASMDDRRPDSQAPG